MGSSETKHKLQDIPEHDEAEGIGVVKSKSKVWLPDRLNSALSELNEDDRKTLLFCRAVTAILNRLTPDNFPSLSEKMKQLPIDSPDRIQRVVLMIHAKAIQESKYCALYAELCDLLSDVQVVNEQGITTPFYLYLIDHCRTFFRNSLNEDFRLDTQKNETNLLSDEEIEKSPSTAFDRKEYIFRTNSVGNCQFIGELFKVYMIHPEIIFQTLDQLFEKNGDLAMECACSILTTIGFFYEEKIGKFPIDYLNKLKSLSTAGLSSRVRFMIQNVFDLKKNYWRPKRRSELPKTSKQIELEFIEEEKSQKLSESAYTFCEMSDWISISENFFKHVHGLDNGENEVSDFFNKDCSFEDSVRHILDNLTYENFDTFSEELNELPIDDTSRLNFVFDLMFERVISKPNTCELYAKLCNGLKNLRVPDGNADTSESTAFKTIVANKCQQLFDDNRTQEAKDNTDESRDRLIVVCRFIAELFKAHVLHVLIVINCVQKLSTSADGMSLECLFEILNIAGKTLSERLRRNKNAYAKLFSKIQSLLENEQCHLSPEMKSVLEDLLGPENLIKPETTDVDNAEASSSSNVQTNFSQELIDDEKDISTEKASGDIITRHDVPVLKTAVPNTLQKTETTVVESHPNAYSVDNTLSKVRATLSLQNNQNSSSVIVNRNLSLYHTKKTEELYSSFYEILCNLPSRNFDKSIEKILNLPINNVPRLQGVLDLIFAEVIKDHERCHLYAQLCSAMENIEVRNEESGEVVTFKVLLINKSQKEFERSKDEELEKLRIQICSQMRKKQMKILLNQKEREFHQEMIAICRFIGELYKQNILVARTIFRCVTKLLDARDKSSLERLCVLLELAGKKLEEEVPLCKKKEFESCFEKIQEIVSDTKTPVKRTIKKMLCDVINMKNNGWVVTSSIFKCDNFKSRSKSTSNYKTVVETIATMNQELLDCFSFILSKFKRENFVDTLLEIAALRIQNSNALNGVIDLILAQVIKKPENCYLYAQLCCAIHEAGFKNDQTFRVIVLDKCLQEFERNKNKELEVTRQQKIIKSCTNNVAKHQFELLFEKRAFEFNRRSVIICRFIGELFNFRISTLEILFCCIDKLLKSEDLLSLVCLCILLKTTGKNLTNLPWNRSIELVWCFDQLQKLSRNLKHNLPPEIISMLQDLITLKNNGWETSSASRDAIDDFENFFLTGVCDLVEKSPESTTTANYETNTRKPDESMNDEYSRNSPDVKNDHSISCDGSDADVQTDSSQTFFDDEEDISAEKRADSLATSSNVSLSQPTNTSIAPETTEQTVSESQSANHSVNEPESDNDSISSFGEDQRPAKLNQNSDISSNDTNVLASFSALLKKLKHNNTTDNLNEIIDKLATSPIDNLVKLNSVMDSIFGLALKKNKNFYLYVELCHAMQNMTVFDEKNGKDITFRQLLNDKCMKDIGRANKEELDLQSKRYQLESCGRPPARAQLKALGKKERKFSRRSINRSRFICELCKREILTLDTTIHCVFKLLDSSNYESLEGACTLLKTVAEKSIQELTSDQKDLLNSICEKMKAIVMNKKLKTNKVLLQKVISLMENKWIGETPSASRAKIDNFETPCSSSQNVSEIKIAELASDSKIVAANEEKTEELKTITLNPESHIVAEDEEKVQNLVESVIEESTYNPLELKDTSRVPPENIAPDMSSKPAILSRRQFNAMESYKLLRSAFDQWILDEMIPHWFELTKYTWRRSTIPKAISELIHHVIRSDLDEAEKCGGFVVYLIKNDYITREEIVKGLRSLFLSTVGNQQMSLELDLVLSPLFESGYLQVDDLNAIFQNNLNSNRSEKVKEENSLENEPASKEHVENDSQSEEVKKETVKNYPKNDSADLPPKIQNVHEQKVVAHKGSSFFDPFSSAASSTSDLTAAVVEIDMTNMRPDQIRQVISDILQTQTPSTFSSAKFKRQMGNIPFYRVAELDFLATSIIKMVLNNPDLFEFYAKLCSPIMMLMAEKMKFWVLLMKACHTYFHQVLFVEDNLPSTDVPSAQFSSIAKNPKKATKKKNKLKGFCRFFSVLVNRMNNDTANANVKRFMKKLLEIRKIDFFCEIYDHLNKNDTHFERSLFESYIPELLSKNELEIEYREMLKRVADDYMSRNSQRPKSQQMQQKNAKTAKKARKRDGNRGINVDTNTRLEENIEDGKLQQNETEELTGNPTSSCVANESNTNDEKSTVSSSNLDTSSNSSSSSDESDQAEPSTYSKSSSSENVLKSNPCYSKLPTNENLPAISHKEILDTTVDVLNQLNELGDISFDLVQRLTNMPINRNSKLANVVHQICNRAMKDANNRRQYVILCQHLRHWSIVDKNTGKSTSFEEQLITVLYTKSYQMKSKIEEYHQNTESVKEISAELLSKVVGFCGFLCEILKSPVFGHEILICPAIELLSLDPIDKNIIGLLEQLLVILTIDLNLKLTTRFSAQEFKQYKLLFKMITFLQEMIDFQKYDYGSSNLGCTDEGVNPSSVNQKNAMQATQEQHQISNPSVTTRREELASFLKMNPAVVGSIVKRFERINEPPEKLLDSVMAPMCESFYQRYKKFGKGDADEEFSYAIIFKSIHETIPSFEFLCMNTVFECVKKLNIPFGMMSIVFEFLFLYEIISYESFIRFKNAHVSKKLSEVMKLFNSPVFQNYKLSPKNFQEGKC